MQNNNNILKLYIMNGYLIIADSRQKPGEKVVLVDRTKCKDQWWTETTDKAIVFEKESAAIIQLGKLKFNNPQVVPFDYGKKRLTQVRVSKHTESNVSRMLDQHVQLWHDDDWYEGMND